MTYVKSRCIPVMLHMRMSILLWLLIFFSIAGRTASSDQGAEIYARYSQSVVQIQAAGEQIDKELLQESGSGFVISNKGHVLTASHVFPDESLFLALVVTGKLGPSVASGKLFKLTLLKRSETHDAALLQMDPVPSGLVPVPMRKTRASPGQLLFILGYPLGLPDTHLIDGRISASDSTGITTNALVNKGNSGGPVLDDKGCAFALVSDGVQSNQGRPVVGMNFTVALADVPGLMPADISSSVTSDRAAHPVIHVSDTLSRFKTDHGLNTDFKRYNDYINARPGYDINEIEAIEQNSINPGEIQYPTPVISTDRKQISLQYTLASGPAYDQWRGWIDMTVHTRQSPTDTDTTTAESSGGTTCQ